MTIHEESLTGTQGTQAANEPLPGLCVCFTNTCTCTHDTLEVSSESELATGHMALLAGRRKTQRSDLLGPVSLRPSAEHDCLCS